MEEGRQGLVGIEDYSFHFTERLVEIVSRKTALGMSLVEQQGQAKKVVEH